MSAHLRPTPWLSPAQIATICRTAGARGAIAYHYITACDLALVPCTPPDVAHALRLSLADIIPTVEALLGAGAVAWVDDDGGCV